MTRRGLMEDRQLGLTALYKLVRGIGPDRGIVALRDLHREIDAEVARSYGWDGDLSANEMIIELHGINQRRHKLEAPARSHPRKPPAPHPDLQPLPFPPELPHYPNSPIHVVDPQRD